VSGVGASGEIAPELDASWPRTLPVAEAVTVTFQAGYLDGDNSPPFASGAVPDAIRGAIRETVATRYQFRESASIGAGFSSLPANAQAALANYRVWRF
jgi:hypothetical protein